jgi:hypothetical protein
MNTLISIVVGIFGIGGYIVGIVSYLRHKAASSQQKQATKLAISQNTPVSQTITKSLSKLDWMEVLWQGFEDCIRVRDWNGVTASITIGVFGAMISG